MGIISNLLISAGAADAAEIKLEKCKIINPRLLSRLDFEAKSVCIGILPYYTRHCDGKRTVSSYAVAPDYHLALRELYERFIGKAKEHFPKNSFAFFADHSPIAEVDAAARAGLGIIGKNQLLITEKYSSFVFIFGIFSDLETYNDGIEPRLCENCGACSAACPTKLKNGGECLSAITQKKKELTDAEADLMISHGTVWGCDICQNVCPYTLRAKKSGSIYTDSPWFNTDIVPCPTSEIAENEDEFLRRAYSWRGKEVFLRNIDLFSKRNKNG